MGKRPKKYVVRRAEQLAALGSPVRSRIVESLSAHGPSSVRELSGRVGRPPESLYYHIRVLVDVGLVVLQTKRRVSRRSEAVYGLVASRLVLDPRQRSGDYMDALADVCAAVLRLAERNYRAAVERGGFRLDGSLRSLMSRRYTVRLDREGLTGLNRHLDSIADSLDERGDGKSGDVYALTVVLSRLADDDGR